MSTITDLLDDLAVRRLTIAEVAAGLREFEWQPSSAPAEDDVENLPPAEDSFDEVQADSRLTARQYARLAAAYREALSETGSDDAFTAASDHWKKQPRDPGGEDAGQWVKTKTGLASVKKVVSAVIYKKHTDGSVVAQRDDRRLRWDATSKKYAADERENDTWVEKQKLTKAAAYAEMKIGDWREPDAGSGAKPVAKPVAKSQPKAASKPAQAADNILSETTPTIKPSANGKAANTAAFDQEFTDTAAKLKKINDDSAIYGKRFKELFEKQYQKVSGILSKYDQSLLDEADEKTAQAWKDAKPGVTKIINLLAQRAQTLKVSDTVESKWSNLPSAQVTVKPKVNRAAMDKIAERYVSKDLVTITNNAALRAGTPDPKALSWAKSIDRMVNSGEITEDTVVYRGAAFSPEFAATLTPGSMLRDDGFMSAGFDNGTARHYANTRQRVLPGYIPTTFEIRTPKGMKAYEVENDEIVFGRGRKLRVIDVQSDGSYLRVITEMVAEVSVKNPKDSAGTSTKSAQIPVDTSAASTTSSGEFNQNYTGPRFELPSSVDRQTLTDFTDLVRRKVQADQLDGVAKLTPDEKFRISALQDTFNLEHVGTQLRIAQEAQVAGALDVWMKQNGVTEEPTEEFKQKLADRVKTAFAGKKIAVRVTPKNLENILTDGRIKTQFETNKSKGNNDAATRAKVEAAWFGIGLGKSLTQMVDQDREKRPVYGYVAVDGVRPAGVGTADMFGVSTDALSQYGQIQVILRDRVRDRTTAMFGDSLNNRHQGLSSPVNQPDWMAFTPSWKSMFTRGLTDLERDVNSVNFRHGNYAEAQIHGGVTLDDVEEIVFPATPTAALRKQLDDAGVSWRVLNFKTAADGTPEERATALRIAEQDIDALDEEITRQESQLEHYQSKNDNYSVKQIEGDVKKMRVQRKRLSDALPALRGEKG